jgi:hypothetical protein
MKLLALLIITPRVTDHTIETESGNRCLQGLSRLQFGASSELIGVRIAALARQQSAVREAPGIVSSSQRTAPRGGAMLVLKQAHQ